MALLEIGEYYVPKDSIESIECVDRNPIIDGPFDALSTAAVFESYTGFGAIGCTSATFKLKLYEGYIEEEFVLYIPANLGRYYGKYYERSVINRFYEKGGSWQNCYEGAMDKMITEVEAHTPNFLQRLQGGADSILEALVGKEPQKNQPS